MLSAHQYKTAFLFQWLRMLAQLQHAENEQGRSQLSSSFCLFVTASVVAVVLPSRKWYGICDIYTGGGKCRNAFAVPSQCSLVRSGDKALKFKATKCFSHWKKPLIVFRMIVLKETRRTDSLFEWSTWHRSCDGLTSFCNVRYVRFTCLKTTTRFS